ncbi:MAG TPA: DNA-3-methyladenine glycosylase [Solirubrobacteraceae bacterium]|nr:DNA-3-methyladenine glycosylase [Solirubrobacteraceae bacterium]
MARLRPYTHLRRADPVLAALLDEHGEPPLREAVGGAGGPFSALVRAIVGQQLSVLAARAIYGRFLEFCGGTPPTPQQILDADPDAMRAAAGLSRAKTGYLRSLAEHVLSGELELDRVGELGDDELIAELTAVKGLGTWTAHMFMIFELRRPDVLATGDLGVRRGAQRAFGFAGLPSHDELSALAEPWRPHRSAACLLLWHSLSNAPG